MPKVYFVGCGPGDPDLITVKAKKLIQKANGIVSACGFIVELKDLNGRMHLGDTPICSVLEL